MLLFFDSRFTGVGLFRLRRIRMIITISKTSKRNIPPPIDPPIIAFVLDCAPALQVISLWGPDIDEPLQEQLFIPGPVLIQTSLQPPLLISQLFIATQSFEINSYPSWQLHVYIALGLSSPLQYLGRLHCRGHAPTTKKLNYKFRKAIIS